MIIYSKSILQFLVQVRSWTKEILTQEVQLKVGNKRVHFKGHTYPLNIVVYEGKDWGYYRPQYWQIALNKRVLFHPKEFVKNILRHEVAHFLTHLEFNKCDHGKEFRQICLRYNWDKNISQSKLVIDESLKEEKLISKIEKLLALSKSSNAFEASSASLKVNELLLKHSLTLPPVNEEEAFVLEVLQGQKITAKMNAISDILSTFHVSCVFNRGRKIVVLEVCGERPYCLTAQHMAIYLDRTLEKIYKNEKKKSKLHRPSFFKGLAQGHLRKFSDLKNTTPQSYALVEKKLNKLTQLAYPRLKMTSQYISENSSYNLGQKAGKDLSLSLPLKNLRKNLFLTHKE